MFLGFVDRTSTNDSIEHIDKCSIDEVAIEHERQRQAQVQCVHMCMLTHFSPITIE
jgi:hypothetical protein